MTPGADFDLNCIKLTPEKLVLSLNVVDLPLRP
jgi:hypothetical protein